MPTEPPPRVTPGYLGGAGQRADARAVLLLCRLGLVAGMRIVVDALWAWGWLVWIWWVDGLGWAVLAGLVYVVIVLLMPSFSMIPGRFKKQ